MVFVVIVIAILMLVSIYLFFRAEKIQEELRNARREFSQAKKVSKMSMDTMALVAAKQEEFLKLRLKKRKELSGSEHVKSNEHEDYLTTLISNYSVIFRACANARNQLHLTVEKCMENKSRGSYKEFISFIGAQESHIKRMWSENSLSGFISLVEALLVETRGAKQTQKKMLTADVA